jgi:hypothetical protein
MGANRPRRKPQSKQSEFFLVESEEKIRLLCLLKEIGRNRYNIMPCSPTIICKDHDHDNY